MRRAPLAMTSTVRDVPPPSPVRREPASGQVRRHPQESTSSYTAVRPPLGHDEVIARIYDAAEGGALDDVLRTLADRFGAEHARLVVAERGVVVGDEHFPARDDADGAPNLDGESVSFRAPAGQDRTVAVTLTWAGGASSDEVRDLGALVTHLGRALGLRQRIRAWTSEIEERRLALDVVAGCVVVVDRRATILCASRSAEELLGRGDGLLARDARLTAVDTRDARSLAAAIAEVASRAARRELGAGAAVPRVIPIVRRERPPIAVVLVPMRLGGGASERGEHARVLAALNDPDRIVRLDPELVARIHGLTPTEAELAVALAEGSTVAEFATQRGCTEQTARTHVKRILSKTGAARQADLVRMLVSSAAMHGLG